MRRGKDLDSPSPTFNFPLGPRGTGTDAEERAALFTFCIDQTAGTVGLVCSPLPHTHTHTRNK